MVQNLTPEQIEQIIMNDLEESNKLTKNIIESLHNIGNEESQTDNDKNSSISKAVKHSAQRYLTRIDTLFKQIQSEFDITKHQKKESFTTDLISLNHAHTHYKLVIKSLYAETIAFQKVVNAALDQEILTVFVLDSDKEGQIFYRFDLDSNTFKNFNPSVTKDGEIQYNINKNFLDQNKITINEDIIGNRRNIIEHQAIFANSKFGKEFNSALQNSTISTKNLSEDQLRAIDDIRKRGLLEVFYTKEGTLRQRLYSQDKNNIENFSEYFTIEEGSALTKNIKINKKRKKIGGKNFSEYTSFNYIVKELNLPKFLSPDFREFTMEGGQVYKLPFRGSKGFLKEAFFGAYFGIEIGKHQIDIPGGRALTINYSYKNEMEPYMAQLDSAAGRLLGDYNAVINGTMHAIQVKGEGASFNIWQFIELANTISKQSETNILKVLKDTQSADRARSHTYQAYQVQDQKMAKKLLSQGIGKLKST